MLSLLFPPKCTLCRQLLSGAESDLCHNCRENAPEFLRAKSNIPFIAHWTAVWYYKDNVRKSIHRFKFGAARHYADVYSRLLAIKLQNALWAEDYDILTWVPVSLPRRLKRGYDQSALVAQALGRELQIPATRTLNKIRHTPPQSGIREAARRRANVLGAYKLRRDISLSGKRILLVDDVVTTGATASECARILLTAGAKEVILAAVAAASHDKNNM